MKKIPTLFLRDFTAHPATVTAEMNPACWWVFNGEGTATRKWDGTCMMLHASGVWWARCEVKPGKTAPDGFVEEQRDEVTGKTVGWEPVERSSFAKFHAEAVSPGGTYLPGTYELVGPKINENPEEFDSHKLIRHGWSSHYERLSIQQAPRDYEGLREWLGDLPYEGLVFHHPDGRMAKIKRRDFPSTKEN